MGSGIHHEVMVSWIQLKTFVTSFGNQQRTHEANEGGPLSTEFLKKKTGHDLEDNEYGLTRC